MLKFSEANAKIEALGNVASLAKFLANNRKVYSFDLLSGWSCPFAKDCLSRAIVVDGSRKIKDGPHTQFRCFSASQEVQYTNVYNLRKSNFDHIRQFQSAEDMASEIDNAMPDNLGICRIHVAGDFFNQTYMLAWIIVARMNPDRLFYAYTKSLKYWVELQHCIPDNFILTASYGGRHDELIEKHNLRFAKVVLNAESADDLPIDHDDSHAADPAIKNNSFALLIHGTQPKGSEAGKAVKLLNGRGSYSRA
jgi:hypothetical protein